MSVHPISQAAARYATQGRHNVVLRPLEKAPKLKGWRTTPAAPQDFAPEDNIGNALGVNGLCEVEGDCPEAIALMPLFLPPTNQIHGRASRPRSHWWYTADGPIETTRYRDPIDNSVLLELRGDGVQTMMPPSQHPDGEEVIWYVNTGEPGDVDHRVLGHYVRRTAAASLLVRHWTAGRRHDVALALGGSLLRNGWNVDDAAGFVSAVASCAGDTDPEKSEAAVRDTDDALQRGRHTTGIPTLRRLLPNEVVDRLCEWLDLNDATESDPTLDEVLTNPDKPATPYIMPFGVFITFPFPAPSWLVEGIIHNQDLNSTGANPKSLKTWFEMYMHMCIASGTWMFDRFVVGEPRKTLYIQDDQSASSFQANVVRLARGMGMNVDLLSENMLFVVQQQVRFDDADSLGRIIAAIREHRPSLVTFDTFRSAHHAEENDSTAMTTIMNTAKSIRDQWETAVSLVHHSNRAGGDLRGSSAIWGALDNQIKIERVDMEGVRYGKVTFDGRGYDWADSFRFHLVDIPGEERDIKIRYDSLNPGEMQTSKERRKVAVLDYLGGVEEASIYDLMEGLGIKSRGSMDVYLKELENEGKVNVSISKMNNKRTYTRVMRPVDDEPDF